MSGSARDKKKEPSSRPTSPERSAENPKRVDIILAFMSCLHIEDKVRNFEDWAKAVFIVTEGGSHASLCLPMHTDEVL